MLPIVIDSNFVSVLVAGEGDATNRRLEMLDEAGVKKVRYIKTSPKEKDFEGVNIAYIADFSDEESAIIAEIARAKGVFLNIEDKKQYCDFHVPSITRRGDLLITASTAGKSPRVARRLRLMFDNMFSKQWAKELDNIGELREGWKAQNYGYKKLADATDEYIEEVGLMSGFCDKCKKV